MAATTLVAARISPELKNRAHGIMREKDLTDSKVIRRVYEYIVHLGEVPEFLLVDEYPLPEVEKDKFQRHVEWMKNGPLSKMDWSFFTDEALAEALAEREF